ncbi:MAG: hypothetical protein OEX21_00140 [Betaproteobacteria bacterium]|nr:hypothetical protein [Betaproteobacteria bacterium]
MARATALLAGALLAAALASHAASPMAVRILDWMLPVPASWTLQVPGSSMRLAQFTIASDGGRADAAVFYFGAAGGGSVEANVARWSSQFLTDKGEPAQPVVEKGTASGMPVTWVALEGRYARGVGTGPQGEALANQSLRVAVLETPRGNLIFQLWGDKAAVARQAPTLRAMVGSLKKAP